MKNILYILLSVLIIVGCASFAFSIYTARDAAAFLRELESIDPNHVDRQEAERLAKRFHSRIFSDESRCTDAQCDYYFRFTNSALSFFKLAPSIRLNGSIKLRDGKLELAGVVFHQVGGPGLDISVVEFPSSPQLTSFKSEITTRNGNSKSIQVHLTGDAKRGEKHAAFLLNTQCLAKIGGCASLEQVAPQLLQISTRE